MTEIKYKVRNCREVGPMLQKIISRLLANDDLVKVLYYTDKDPLSQLPLTNEEKEKYIYEKLIKITPRVGPKETAQSIVVLDVVQGAMDQNNDQFRNFTLRIEVFVPLTQWIIKDENLRPYVILGEIQESLNKKDIGGIGMLHGGDFELNFLTEEISAYNQEFYFTTYA